MAPRVDARRASRAPHLVAAELANPQERPGQHQDDDDDAHDLESEDQAPTSSVRGSGVTRVTTRSVPNGPRPLKQTTGAGRSFTRTFAYSRSE